MIRQCLNALDEKTQPPFELDPHGAAEASSRNPLHQQPFDKTTLVIRDEVLLEALDELAPTVAALMVLFAVVNVAIFLVLWGLTLRTHISDDHRLLLTSPKFGMCFWSTVTENQLASITWISLPVGAPAATITSTSSRTSSAASSGSCSAWPSAYRYSMTIFCPST
jgi:hypothetical protein